MKKHTKCFLSLLAALTLTWSSPWAVLAASPVMGRTAAVSASAAVGQAERVGLRLSSPHSSSKYWMALDNKELSSYYFKDGKHFTVTGNGAFSSLYLKFEMPATWTVTLPDGTVLEGGKEGYLHEYMPLGQSVSSVELDLMPGARFCDIYAFTDGEPPEWVQRWEPPCEEADLLLLPTHADDEHLWFGGAMPYYAGELGYEVQVVYLTIHSNYTVRNHELLDGLWTVGVTHYPIISERFPDEPRTKNYNTALKVFGYENVLDYEVEMLRRFKPKVVIGHDINGEYGHGAHRLCAKALLEAVELTNDPSAFPESAEKYGTFQVQKCYLHLWQENQIVMNWGQMKLAHFGGRTALDMAKEGFKCHDTQKKDYSVRDYGKNDCRKFGLAYTTVGLDTEGKNDMFEHVVWPDNSPAESDQESVSSGDDASASRMDDAPAAERDFGNTVYLTAAGALAAVLAAVTGAVLLLRRRK